MPIKPFTPLRLLNATTTTHTLSLARTALYPMKPTQPLKNTYFLSRILPFRLRFLALTRLQHRPFSTRPGNRGPGQVEAEFRGSGSDLGSKSLVDEEAEMSDWVSELRTSSSFRGMLTSDEEESERSRVRRVVRSRNGGGGGGGGDKERNGFSVKRRRGEERGSFSRSDSVGRRGEERGSFSRSDSVGRRGEERGSFSRNDSMGRKWGGREFGNDDRRDRSRSARSGGFDDRSDKRRGPFVRRGTQFGSDLDDDDDNDEEEERYGSRSGRRDDRGNVGRRNGLKGGREQDSGSKRERAGVVKGMRGGREHDSGFKSDRGTMGKRRAGFSENGFSDYDDAEDRETLVKEIGDLLGDEESDDVDEIEGDDADIDNDVRSSFGLEKEARAKNTAIYSGKSDSYLSETR